MKLPTLSGSARRVLALVAVVVLAAVLALEAWVLWVREPAAPTAERPVTISDVRQAAAVDAAADSLSEILTTTWKDYDAQAEQAQDLMTDEFAAEYGQTSDDIKSAFVEGKTSVEVKVAWAGVYRAGPEKVQALVFLDQVVTRGQEAPRTTPFRALVTVVPAGEDDEEWLVAAIDTR